MLTKLTIRNFKRFGEVEIPLGNPVLFIGPNNSGKTSAMQALTLWETGVKRWNEKRGARGAPEKRPGVTVNRRDLFAIPHPDAIHLWRGLRVRDVRREDGRRRTNNVRIDITVEGINENKPWKCGLEFDYANQESFYCRPLRLEEDGSSGRMPVPAEAASLQVAFLPSMSGLTATETRLDQGALNVRVGEGRTAEVLRNLCLRILGEDPERWSSLVGRIEELFGARLEEPRYAEERGEITMGYREPPSGAVLDLSSSGRGLQQTLLILAYMYANPGAVLLLDEPDAHLEILRQRQIYNLISETASASGSQIIATSHSQVLLNEAAGKDTVIAFVGAPHRIGDKNSHVYEALANIGFDQYFQAEQTGWVLYLEGSKDLAVLRTFARRLGRDDAVRALERAFVHYVGNRPQKAEEHFRGLREALPGLGGVSLFDRPEEKTPEDSPLRRLVWKRSEIENYLCTERTLQAYARESAAAATAERTGPLFAGPEIEKRSKCMEEAVAETIAALKTPDQGSPWDGDTKVKDRFLAPLFATYFSRIGIPNLMDRKSFHELADYVPHDEIDPEIGEKLDAIASAAESAKPPADG